MASGRKDQRSSRYISNSTSGTIILGGKSQFHISLHKTTFNEILREIKSLVMQDSIPFTLIQIIWRQELRDWISRTRQFKDTRPIREGRVCLTVINYHETNVPIQRCISWKFFKCQLPIQGSHFDFLTNARRIRGSLCNIVQDEERLTSQSIIDLKIIESGIEELLLLISRSQSLHSNSASRHATSLPERTATTAKGFTTERH